MKILILRHGETKGNREKRYVGQRSKEGLTDQAREQLRMAVAGRMEENEALWSDVWRRPSFCFLRRNLRECPGF